MGFKDILVHVDSTPASAVRLQLGISLARRFGARMSGLHVTPDPDVPPYFKPSAVARIAKIYREGAREAALLAEAHFRDATKDIDLITAWKSVEGDIARVLGERARFADLLLVGQQDTENPPAIAASPCAPTSIRRAPRSSGSWSATIRASTRRPAHAGAHTCGHLVRSLGAPTT